MDVDICGPSIPKMLGLEGQEIHRSNAGWSPVYVQVPCPPTPCTARRVSFWVTRSMLLTCILRLCLPVHLRGAGKAQNLDVMSVGG